MKKLGTMALLAGLLCGGCITTDTGADKRDANDNRRDAAYGVLGVIELIGDLSTITDDEAK